MGPKRAGTFKQIRNLNEVDLAEWDVLITEAPHAEIGVSANGALLRQHWDRVPRHLFIFRVFSAFARGRAGAFLEFNVDEDDEADIERSLQLKADVAGSEMRSVSGLAEPIKDLVKSSLFPAVENRFRQFGFVAGPHLEPAVSRLRPFLIGPSDLIMAGSYDSLSGAAVWFLPSDIESLELWFEVALAEWHLRDQKTFPNVTTWQTDSLWETSSEKAARIKLVEMDSDFVIAEAKYQSARSRVLRELQDANQIALDGPKALLTAQGQELEVAVLEALTRLGFEVAEMDEIWDPRERREDFRIKDPAAPGWMVIADATGVAKGAPGSKIVTVMGYVTKFVNEESPARIPGVWIIVNRLFHRDPIARGDIYRGDDLAVLKDQLGLALDSAALYLLDQSIAAGSERAHACRTWLRDALGQITARDAQFWLEETA